MTSYTSYTTNVRSTATTNLIFTLGALYQSNLGRWWGVRALPALYGSYAHGLNWRNASQSKKQNKGTPHVSHAIPLLLTSPFLSRYYIFSFSPQFIYIHWPFCLIRFFFFSFIPSAFPSSSLPLRLVSQIQLGKLYFLSVQTQTNTD